MHRIDLNTSLPVRARIINARWKLHINFQSDVHLTDKFGWTDVCMQYACNVQLRTRTQTQTIWEAMK